MAIDDVRKLFPQLEVIGQIGRGGMGVVYKARQPQLDRMVALKILSVGPGNSGAHASFAERFSREARALARLNHPNIVAVFDFGQAGDHFYFIMEYVDGANLRQMIAAKQITPETALTIVPKVCEALQFAHDEGILHRDIKPENILIDKKGRVKIADFGLAKLVGDDTVDHSLTGTQQIMGTPRYMAPEQFENTKTVDHRADIYSLGVVFYEMLTGELPMGRFAVPSKKVQVDVRLDEVVLRSLEKEPELRYQHASEIKSDVENITQHAVRSGGTPAAVAPRMGDRSVAPPAAGNSIAANFQSLERPAHVVFLRSMLWLVVVFGAVMFCWFEKQTMFNSPGPDDDRTTIRVGAVTPWLVTGTDAAGGRYVTPNFATVSAFAALCAIVAGLALFSTRKAVSAAGNSADATFQSLEPRLSKCALLGVIWAAFTPLGWPAWQMCIRQYFDNPERFATYSTGYVIICATVCLLAATAWLGSMILGGVAIAQIKRSGGKLYGLPLASASLLVYPLLALGSLAFYITNLICFAIAFNLRTPVQPVPGAPPVRGLAVIDFAVIDSLIALAVMFFAARFAWRKISGKSPATGKSADANFQSLEKPLDHRVAEAVMTGIPGWFNARAKWVQSLVQTVLMVVFLVGLFAFLSFNFRASSGSGQSEKVIAFGAPAPWLEIVSEPMSSKWLIHPFAPSVVLALLGAAAAFIYEKIRRSRPGFDAEKDRRLMRRWLIAMGVVFAALVVAAVVLFSARPQRGATVKRELPTPPSFEMQAELSKVKPYLAQGRSEAVFSFTGLSNHAFSIWLEIWKDGQMEIVPALSERITPALGDAVKGEIQLAMQAGADGKMGFEWTLLSNARKANVTPVESVTKREQRANPFKDTDTQTSTWQKEWRWMPQPGQTVTLLAVCGYRAGSTAPDGGETLSEEALHKGWPNGAILLRARYDAVPSNQLLPGPVTKSGAIDESNRSPLPAGWKSEAVERTLSTVPQLGEITSGFGAEFSVPAGQVAFFEIMAERDGGLVPVPPHCAYVRAPADSAVNGTFHWFPSPNQTGNGKRWRIEVVSGAGNGSTGGLLLADELDEAVGSSALTLGVLEPNEITVYGNGRVRLRITTTAHNSKTGAMGIAATDWREPKVPAAGKTGVEKFQ